MNIMQKTYFSTLLPVVLLLIVSGFSANTSALVMELDRIVAIVNDDVITASELDNQMQTIRKQLIQQQIQLPPSIEMQRQVLDRLILNHIQLQLAELNGIRVDEETLNNTISNIASQNDLSLSEFRETLQQDGFDFEEFRENIRDEIIMRRLRQRHVDTRITVTEQEVDNFIANQKTQGNSTDEYKLGHILIGLPEIAAPDQIKAAKQRALKILEGLKTGDDFSQTAITESDGQQALDGGGLGWRKSSELPSLFSAVAPEMEVGELSDIIRSSSGFHIIKMLDYRGAERHIVTQTMARHILIRPNELINHNDAQELLSLYKKRIEGGENFSTLAKKHSDDKATATNGGSLDWISPGTMVSDFEQNMDKVQIGEISSPFKTGFGWHIVLVVDRREHDITEEYNKNKIHDSIYQRKIEEEHANWLRRIRNDSYVDYRLN